MIERDVDDSEIHPCCRECWSDGDCEVEEMARFVMLSSPLKEICEIVERLVVVRVETELID